MHIGPYLNFDGDCAEAFRFYEQTLGGKIESMFTFAESPMAGEMAPEWQNRVMHTRLVVDGHDIMGSDTPPGERERPQGLYVSLSVEKTTDAKRIFDAFAGGGQVQMPFEPTFWAPGGFGMVVDRFGTPWMVNCEEGAPQQ